MLYRSLWVALVVLSLFASPFALQAQEECSADGTLEEIQTVFVNKSNTPITLYWVNYECNEESTSLIEPGASLSQTTFDGHEFAFRDSNGNLLLYFVANMLIDDNEVDILRTINEGAAAGAMWTSINPAREELGLEPIYFSGILYEVAQEAAALSGGDYSAFGSAIADMGLASDIGWAGNSEGPLSGVLLSTSELTEIINRSAQESIDNSDDFGWLNPDVKSFAVYSDENQFGYIFSTLSQPELAMANPEIMGAAMTENAIVGSAVLSSAVLMDQYSFEGQAGVLYAFLLASDEFDTLLRVYDADGNELAMNDDGAGDLNSLLYFTAPADGVYTLGVDSYVDEATGYYTLEMTNTSEVILDFLTAEGVSDNILNVEEGTKYFVAVNSEAFDTTLTILDVMGNEVAFDDDSGDELNSRLVFTAETTGSYTIRVGSYDTLEDVAEYDVLIGTFSN